MRDRIGSVEQELREKFGRECLAILLTYSQEKMPWGKQHAEITVRRFVEKLRKRYQRRGMKFCAIHTTKTTYRGQVQHEVIISPGMEPEELESAWGMGWSMASTVVLDTKNTLRLAMELAADRR